MIAFLRANDLLTDPRAAKYLQFYKEQRINFFAIAWNRELKDNKLLPSGYIYFQKKAEYNQGKKAVLNRLKWNFFLLKQLFKERKKYDIIHACDFDTVMPALFMKLFGKKVIFDVFDAFSATIKVDSYFIMNAIKKLEGYCVDKADYLILCETQRKKQFPKMKRTDILIFPNIPEISVQDMAFVMSPENAVSNNFENKQLPVISYVGGFYEDRFLPELLETASNSSKFNLIIAGFGDPKIEALCEEYGHKYANILYKGRVEYVDGLNIMNNSDIIFAMYCKSNPNHIYAAPNKFYEALMLGKPIITTAGTLVGDKVATAGTGFVIEESITGLNRIFDTADQDIQMKQYAENARRLWNTGYKNYVADFLNKKYIEIIK